MSRPLHFFGGLGVLGMFAGSAMAASLLGMKIVIRTWMSCIQHGPMFVIGSVLIVSGIQLLAIGLLGELQVRHYYSSQRPTAYAVDRLVAGLSDEQSLLSERQEACSKAGKAKGKASLMCRSCEPVNS